MTINSTNRKAGPFSGDGTTTAFPFSFKVFSAADVYVVQADTTGAETVKTLTTDYTVSLNSDQNANPGGTVTMLTPPPTGYKLTLTSALQYLQQTDLTNQGGFYPNVITDALDRITIFVQQLADSVGRSLKTSITTPSGVNPTLPTPVPYQLLSWNGNGTGFQNTDPTYSTALATDLASAASGKGGALVGFLQTGSGAAARTTQDKLRERVSVKDFGAVGDGVTNDLPALNLAMAYLGTLGGGELYFPHGCMCAINGTFTVSVANTVLNFADWTAGIKPSAAMTNLIAITADGCRVLNGNFSNASSYATNAINRTGSSSFGTQVIGNYIASFANGVTWSAAGNNGLLAQNNFFNALTNAAFNFIEDGRTSTITSNVINGGKYGLYSDFTTQQLEGLIFTGNSVFPTINGGSAIYCHGALYWYVSGNVLDAYGTGVSVNFNAGTTSHQITYVTLDGNHIGISASSNGVVLSGNCSYVKIKDNTFDGTTSSVGLNMNGSTFCRVSDNEFVNLTGTQISLVNVTYSNFTGNQMRGAGVTAVEDSACQNIWFGNFGGVNTKSPKSYFLWNWQDDVLSTESDWTSFTPSVSPTSGAITTLSATGAYRRLGKTIEVTISITVTTNGTGGGQLLVGLPAIAKSGINQVLTAASNAPSVFACNGFINAGNASMFVNKYDGTYPAANGSVIIISGVYQAN